MGLLFNFCCRICVRLSYFNGQSLLSSAINSQIYSIQDLSLFCCRTRQIPISLLWQNGVWSSSILLVTQTRRYGCNYRNQLCLWKPPSASLAAKTLCTWFIPRYPFSMSPTNSNRIQFFTNSRTNFYLTKIHYYLLTLLPF